MPSPLTSLLLAGLLGAASPPAFAAAPADAAAGDIVPIEAIVLRFEGLDASALTEAVRVRSAGRTLTPTAREAAEGGRRFAFVDARGEADGSVTLSIVVSDGTAYFRELPADAKRSADDRVRVVAATMANLLAAIEESRVEPDAVDVPMPEPVAAPEPAPPTPKIRKPEPPRPPPPKPPRMSVWVDAAPAVVLALGPPSPTGLAGIGGRLAVDLRHRSGGLATLAVRGVGRRVDDFVAGRARISAGGGFGGNRGAFDWGAAVLVDAEPLWVRQGGERIAIGLPGGDARQTVWSLGGHARLNLAWAPTLAKSADDAAQAHWIRLRLGPTVEVGGSGLLSGGVARLQRRSASAPGGAVDLLRAGGLELSVLLSVGVGVSLPR